MVNVTSVDTGVGIATLASPAGEVQLVQLIDVGPSKIQKSQAKELIYPAHSSPLQYAWSYPEITYSGPVNGPKITPQRTSPPRIGLYTPVSLNGSYVPYLEFTIQEDTVGNTIEMIVTDVSEGVVRFRGVGTRNPGNGTGTVVLYLLDNNGDPCGNPHNLGITLGTEPSISNSGQFTYPYATDAFWDVRGKKELAFSIKFGGCDKLIVSPIAFKYNENFNLPAVWNAELTPHAFLEPIVCSSISDKVINVQGDLYFSGKIETMGADLISFLPTAAVPDAATYAEMQAWVV